MTGFVLSLEIVGGVLVLIAGILVFLTLRQRVLLRRAGTFTCSVRGEWPKVTRAWRSGVARFELDRLDWFRTVAVLPRPAASFERDLLEVVERRRPRGAEALLAVPGSTVVTCRYGDRTVELAMGEPEVSALVSWLESGPPGRNLEIP